MKSDYVTTILLCVLLLVSGAMVFAHEPQGQGRSAQSAAPTPPPDNQTTPPLDCERQSRDEVNRTMQDEIREVLEDDPILDGAQIHATVDDEAITLTGTVHAEVTRWRALQLVDPYTRPRKLVDRITVEPRSSDPWLARP